MINEFIRSHADDDIRKLALQASKYPDVDMIYALTQIEGRQTARMKIPSWAAIDDVLYPHHLSMEQCSSETTAIYKANLAKRLIAQRHSMADLTGGFGIDFFFIGREFDKPVYVERQESLCVIAKHNFTLLDLNKATIICNDGTKYLGSMAPVDLTFIDPARRDANGGRTIAISDCTPDMTQIEDILLKKSIYTIVKLSPMLDWHQVINELHSIQEIHIIAVNNECKELLLVLTDKEISNLTISCVDINNDKTVIFDYIIPTLKNNQVCNKSNANCKIPDKKSSLQTHDDELGIKGMLSNLQNNEVFLYEPNAAIMKAGCFDSLMERYNVKAIGKNSHLFISTKKTKDFPGRKFIIESISNMNKKDLKSNFGDLTHANITTRNFPMSVNELRKKLKLIDGGNIYLFATTTFDKRHVILRCHKQHLSDKL